MPSWKGQTRGGVLGYKIFVLTLRIAGLRVAYFILGCVVFYYCLFAPAAARASYRFYRHIRHFSAFRSLLGVYRNFYAFGQILLDKIVMLAGFTNKFTFNFEGEEHLRNMHEGGLLISAHVGNWEIAGQLLNRLDKKVNILLFDAEHQQIKKYLDQVYTNRNVHFIVIREDFSHFEEIRQAALNKEIIAMHGDRYVEGNRVVPFTFIGKTALFPTGPFTMAGKIGLPVSFVFAVKETPTHYHFFATPAKRIEHFTNLRLRNGKIREIMQEYIENIEKTVNRYPFQWFNFYNFWIEDNSITN